MGQPNDLEASRSRRILVEVLDILLEGVFYKMAQENTNSLEKCIEYPQVSSNPQLANSISSNSPPKVDDSNRMKNRRQCSSAAGMTKNARNILNDWFHANIQHPYPSEAMKRELANKAGISIEQVNTFFGNKRMRTKRKVVKLCRNRQEMDTSSK